MCRGKVNKLVADSWPTYEFHAEGGNSWVFTDKKEAVKIFRRFGDQGRYRRFLKEATTMMALAGLPGVVPILFVNDAAPPKPIQCDQLERMSDLAYFSMPFYSKTLEDLIPELVIDDGSLAVTTTLDICKVIQHIHRKNFAHRDLKPQNVLFDELFAKPWVSDYGLSIDLNDMPTPEERYSDQLELIGSITFRASELLRGRLDSSDHRPCDIYSIGRILWTLIFGKEPVGISDREFLELSVAQAGKDIPNPRTLDDIIRAATNPDPKGRILIDDLIKALSQWSDTPVSMNKNELLKKILNEPTTMAQFKTNMLVKEIQEAHETTVRFIRDELRSLTNGWKELANDYAKSMTGNNDTGHYSEISAIDFSSDDLGLEKLGPNQPVGVGVAFNLGNTNNSPVMRLCLLIEFNPNKWDQRYIVVAAYIPKGWDGKSKPILLSSPKATAFSYQSSGIRQQILFDLKEGFKKLNQVLES